MVRPPKALEVFHLPLLSLVPTAPVPVTELERFSSSLFARLETARASDKKAAEREMLEQVQRFLESQRNGAGGGV